MSQTKRMDGLALIVLCAASFAGGWLFGRKPETTTGLARSVTAKGSNERAERLLRELDMETERSRRLKEDAAAQPAPMGLAEIDRAGFLVVHRDSLKRFGRTLLKERGFSSAAVALFGLTPQQLARGDQILRATMDALYADAAAHVRDVKVEGSRTMIRVDAFPEQAASRMENMLRQLEREWPSYSVEIFRALDAQQLWGGRGAGFSARTIAIEQMPNSSGSYGMSVMYETSPGAIASMGFQLSPGEAISLKDRLLTPPKR